MKVRFPDQLKVREIGDGTTWELISDFQVVMDGNKRTVPAGFFTDFASIPRIVRSIIPVLGRQNKASVLHDWLYVTQPCSRPYADAAFLAGMRASNVPLIKRSIMYVAVRVGGWTYWRH